MNWHGHLERGLALRVLGNVRFVAETNGLVGARVVGQVVMDLAMLLALWGRGQCRGDAMHSSNPPQWRPAPAVTAALSLARRAPRLPMPAGRRPAWRYAPSVDNPPMRHGGVR